jgi:hypothetical protein
LKQHGKKSMKVGDLIKCSNRRPVRQGIIIETGVYVGRKDILVLWSNGTIWTERSKDMKTIKETNE